MEAEQALLTAVLAGDGQAAERLVRQYYQQVYAFLYRMTGDYHTAADLTQDSFIKALTSLQSFRQRGNFISWLLAIASNKAKDHWRRQSRQATTPVDQSRLAGEVHTAGLATSIHRRDLIREALAHLPAPQREAIILRYYHDLKVKDIAEICDANLSTVKSRLRLGLIRLRKYLEGGKDEE